MGSSLVDAFGLLDNLEITSSRNEKIEIIKSGRNNDLFLFLVESACNPFARFYIQKIDEVPFQEDKTTDERSFEMFKIILKELSERVLTGNEAINSVKLFFGTLNEQEQKWYGRVLKKDLQVGATATTFNKVIGANFIPTFDCMLAKSWDEIKNKPDFVFVEPKLDGYRALAFVESGNVSIFTRNGREIEGFSEVENELLSMPSGYVYDGEITGVKNHFQDMQKNVFRKDDKNKKGIFNVFDLLRIEEFVQGKSKASLSARKTMLKNIFADFKQLKYVKAVDHAGPMKSDSETVDMLYNMYVQQGFEGVMLKDAVGKYECKRSNSWGKVKPNETYDLEIVDVVEGEGKFKDKLGAFVVDFRGHRVNVGSGYTDKQRVEFWKERVSIVGQIMEVEAQETTNNEKGGESLRFPVFKKIRYDK